MVRYIALDHLTWNDPVASFQWLLVCVWFQGIGQTIILSLNILIFSKLVM